MNMVSNMDWSNREDIAPEISTQNRKVHPSVLLCLLADVCLIVYTQFWALSGVISKVVHFNVRILYVRTKKRPANSIIWGNRTYGQITVRFQWWIPLKGLFEKLQCHCEGWEYSVLQIWLITLQEIKDLLAGVWTRPNDVSSFSLLPDDMCFALRLTAKQYRRDVYLSYNHGTQLHHISKDDLFMIVVNDGWLMLNGWCWMIDVGWLMLNDCCWVLMNSWL